jgi:hypothetical protein
MNSLLTRSLDRLIIRLAAKAMASPGRHLPHADKARELLGHPDFFCDFVRSPELVFIRDGDFQFPSPIETPWENNNVVRGKLFCCEGAWQNFPSLILLHGWNDELGYRFRLPFCARLLNRRGINVAMIELPYHLQRRPHAPGAITDFISEDLWRMVEATRQSIADVRALVNWFSSLGCGQIGLWGTSLGAWLGGLMVCHEPKIQVAVLTTPIPELEQVIDELEFCAPIRRSFESSNLSLERLNLTSQRPFTSKESIMIQEAEDDVFAPKNLVEELWRAWNEPEIWRLKHAHISVLMSVPVMRRTADWVARKF